MALAAQTVDAPSTPDEITVAGKRFDRTRGVLRKNMLTGKIACEVQKSSGDVAIDAGVCKVASQCFRTRGKPTDFKSCVLEGRERFLDGYFASKQEDYARNQ
jgi:hypothetical protein